MIIHPAPSTAELAPNVSYCRFIFSSHFEEYPPVRTNETEQITYHIGYIVPNFCNTANQ